MNQVRRLCFPQNQRAIFLLLLAACDLAGGCAYSVHQNHLSDFTQPVSSSKTKKISTDVKGFDILLSLQSSFDIVKEARRKLENQCKKGEITGISTVYRTDLGFLSYHSHIRMSGYCVGNG